MATKKEKQELVDILKFTPITVTLSIQGYGGESYAGVVDRKIYEYFKARKLDLEVYASDYDNEMNVPDEMQPFPAGSAYECDGLWHASGAELSDLNTISVTNEHNDTIWEHNAGYADLEDSGVTVNEIGGTEIADLDEGTVVFWGGQGEKGCFFDAEFTLRAPFDPKKLTINYENCDDWYIITSVEYDGEELDGHGGYSTTGKWGENKWVIVGDEEVYEPSDEEEEDIPVLDGEEMQAQEAIDSIEVTDWFDKDTAPAYKGEYEVVYDAAWPNSGMGMAEWTGRSWKQNGKKLAILKWRGLKSNPNEV